jgi:hypothetical protein
MVCEKNVVYLIKVNHHSHLSLRVVLLITFILNQNVCPIFSQLIGSEKTMEQFLDRLLHESVYDRRIRPFYTDGKSKHFSFFILVFYPRSWKFTCVSSQRLETS